MKPGKLYKIERLNILDERNVRNLNLTNIVVVFDIINIHFSVG